MRNSGLSLFFAGILAILTSQPSIAGETFEECVEFAIQKCGELNDPADVSYSLCILYGIDSCYSTHGGGSGGVEPVANNFTTEQQDTFDALVKDLKALRQESTRLKDELTEFLFELRSDAYRNVKQGSKAE